MFNHRVFYALSLSQKQKLQFDVMPAALANMHSNVDRHMYPLILRGRQPHQIPFG